jgi:hypothetical protein
MKMHNIKSTIAVIGLLLVFILGGIAVGVEQESLPVGPAFALGWQPSLPAEARPLDKSIFRVGLCAETSNVLDFLPREAQRISVLAKPLSGPGPLAIPSDRIVWKVSLHLLDSVLLI